MNKWERIIFLVCVCQISWTPSFATEIPLMVDCKAFSDVLQKTGYSAGLRARFFKPITDQKINMATLKGPQAMTIPIEAAVQKQKESHVERRFMWAARIINEGEEESKRNYCRHGDAPILKNSGLQNMQGLQAHKPDTGDINKVEIGVCFVE